jgi:hypothetical protein
MQSGDIMELANVLLALGGDRNNTVPKYEVTAAEIAVLVAIHGIDAVHDIEPLEKTRTVSFKEERERLLGLYPAKNEDNKLIVLEVYPGVAPVLHTEIATLGLDETLFKATQHAKPVEKAKPKGAKAVAPPPPVSAIAKDSSSADHLFPDEDAAPAGVME